MERDSGLNPIALPGQRIGLLGGSFDPAHAGHLHISEMALRRFRLDRVWWLVSPGNPLKPHGPAPLAERIAAARPIPHDPRLVVRGGSYLHPAVSLRVTARSWMDETRHAPDVGFRCAYDPP